MLSRKKYVSMSTFNNCKVPRRTDKAHPERSACW
jgi:hypothetical protein